MKLVKFEGCKGDTYYVNPMNITTIQERTISGTPGFDKKSTQICIYFNTTDSDYIILSDKHDICYVINNINEALN